MWKENEINNVRRGRTINFFASKQAVVLLSPQPRSDANFIIALCYTPESEKN